MKFCPECGSSLENKEMCNCGYEVSTGKVNIGLDRVAPE